ncbi:MAG: hypothetical protein ACLUNV_07150 [Sutterella wadsworthensis]
MKDFSARPWWVRTFIAPFLLRRELSILARLRGVEGVSQESFRIDREAMAVLFMEGSNIGREPSASRPPILRRSRSSCAPCMRAASCISTCAERAT